MAERSQPVDRRGMAAGGLLLLAWLALGAVPVRGQLTFPAEIHADPVSAGRHLKEAVRILVEREGPLESRLAAAAANQLTFPQPEWFPTPEMSKKFERIQQRLYDEQGRAKSLATMSPRDERMLATDIFALYLELREYLVLAQSTRVEEE